MVELDQWQVIAWLLWFHLRPSHCFLHRDGFPSWWDKSNNCNSWCSWGTLNSCSHEHHLYKEINILASSTDMGHENSQCHDYLFLFQSLRLLFNLEQKIRYIPQNYKCTFNNLIKFNISQHWIFIEKPKRNVCLSYAMLCLRSGAWNSILPISIRQMQLYMHQWTVKLNDWLPGLCSVTTDIIRNSQHVSLPVHVCISSFLLRLECFPQFLLQIDCDRQDSEKWKQRKSGKKINVRQEKKENSKFFLVFNFEAITHKSLGFYWVIHYTVWFKI